MDNTILLHPADNVKVILNDHEGHFSAPVGHKIAIKPIALGETVYKYGYPIGRATGSIEAGEWVHSHNLASGLEGTASFDYRPYKSPLTPLWKAPEGAVFQGYRRSNGEAGIRNEIWIINTVGCCNKIAEELARRGRDICAAHGVEGPYAFSHPYGCSQLGDDLRRTQKLLTNLVRHPNAGGVLILGLGCENNHLTSFKEVLGEWDPQRVKFLNAQDVDDEIEEGSALLEALSRCASRFKREPISTADLVVGMKCGGSDAFSGITANPLTGHLADTLIAAGASALLTEIPEMFGAEEIMLGRAESEGVFRIFLRVIDGFKDYYRRHDYPIYENPSPGNREGGITTLEEKSLGCVLKGGRSPVADIKPYGERACKKGLSILEGPGNDLVSVSNLAAAGAHLIVFTTGRGTPYGGPVPTLKISSNSLLFAKKKNWLDFDAGRLLEGTPMEDLAEELFNLIIATASGEQYAVNEKAGYREIAIFKNGVTL